MSGQTDTIGEIDQQLDNLGRAVKTHNTLIGNDSLALIWGGLYLICKCLIDIARKMERGG